MTPLTCRAAGFGGVLLLALVLPVAAHADDHFALVVSGASGGPEYAERLERWRSGLVDALREQPGFRDDHLRVLAELPGPGVGRASRAGVRDAVAGMGRRMDAGSVLLVVLLGHGTFDGADARFNLVGPDLAAREWRALLDPLPGTVVFVNTTAASSPFLDRLAGPGRVIVTATGSPAQRYETVFPEYFVAALRGAAGDADKDGRVSVWEAFAFAADGVRRFYQRAGRLATERPRLDDTGDGIGREWDRPGPDGALAARLHAGARAGERPDPDDPSLAPLLTRRSAIETRIAELRSARETMEPAAYRAAIEPPLVELARISRQLRRLAAERRTRPRARRLRRSTVRTPGRHGWAGIGAAGDGFRARNLRRSTVRTPGRHGWAGTGAVGDGFLARLDP